MHSSNLNIRERLVRLKRIRLILAIVLAILLVCFAVLTYFVPLKSLLFVYSIEERKEGELRLHFLDAGQGDCTIVEFPSGNALIVDGGDGSFSSRNRLVRYLKGLSINSLSLLVTHADSDHFGAFEEILRLFAVDKFYLPVVEGTNANYSALIERIENADCERETLTRYSVIADPSGAYINCISPYSVGETDENDSSSVLFISYNGVNALFTGDISATREELLLREYALDRTLFDCGDYTVRLEETDILKVAHHGSKNSSSEKFLSLIGAETAIVSAGRGNAYSHPSGDALARLRESGAEIYRIDELGSVMVSVSGGEYSTKTHITE